MIEEEPEEKRIVKGQKPKRWARKK